MSFSQTAQVVTAVGYPVSAEGSRAIGPAKLHKNLLIQYLITIVPLPPAFYLGHPNLGGYAFVLMLGSLLGYYAIRKKPYEYLCILVGSLPLMSLLRGTFMPYNTPLLTLGFIVFWAATGRPELQGVWKRKDVLLTILFSFAYWIASYLLTQDYSRNIRMAEWGLGIAAVLVLSDRRSYLATAALSAGLSVIAMSLSLLPYGDRLGMGYIPGMDWQIGNPIQIGVPAAFVILLCLAENGRWLLLENHPYWRVMLASLLCIFLLLSTSRGAWLVMIIGAMILAVLDKGTRKPVLISGLIVVCMVLVTLQTTQFVSFNHYIMQTFSSETSIDKLTTGRSEQWAALPDILEASPLYGFGPGSGRDTSRKFSGKGIVFHSLFLQAGAELGFIGFGVLAIFFYNLFAKCILHYRAYGETVPLLGLLSFIVMATGVPGLDCLGSVLVGFGFIGGNSRNLWIVQQHWTGRIYNHDEMAEAESPLAVHSLKSI